MVVQLINWYQTNNPNLINDGQGNAVLVFRKTLRFILFKAYFLFKILSVYLQNTYI